MVWLREQGVWVVVGKLTRMVQDSDGGGGEVAGQQMYLLYCRLLRAVWLDSEMREDRYEGAGRPLGGKSRVHNLVGKDRRDGLVTMKNGNPKQTGMNR